MKKIFLFLGFLFLSYNLFAQNNTFPTSGNVGIGTTSPNYQFTTSGKAGRIASFGNDSNIDSNVYIGVGGSRGQFGYNGNSKNAVVQGSAGKGVEFNVNNTFGSGQAMVIGSDGNVSVGSTDPAYHLSVEGAGIQSLVVYSTDVGATNTTKTLIRMMGENSSGTKREQVRFGSAPGVVNTNGGQFILSTSNTSGTLTERMRVDDAGNFGIGTTPISGELLAVEGIIHGTAVRVNTSGFPDYVFNNDYPLMTLPEVGAYIQANHHLPEVPAEKEVVKNGMDLGEMNKLLVKKVEELTLYLIDQDKKNNALDQQNRAQQTQIDALSKKLDAVLGKLN